MTRLIDADLLEKEIYKWMPKDQETWMDSDLPPIENLVVSIMMTIQEQPTVDAVPVEWIEADIEESAFSGYDMHAYEVATMLEEWKEKERKEE